MTAAASKADAIFPLLLPPASSVRAAAAEAAGTLSSPCGSTAYHTRQMRRWAISTRAAGTRAGDRSSRMHLMKPSRESELSGPAWATTALQMSHGSTKAIPVTASASSTAATSPSVRRNQRIPGAGCWPVSHCWSPSSRSSMEADTAASASSSASPSPASASPAASSASLPATSGTAPRPVGRLGDASSESRSGHLVRSSSSTQRACEAPPSLYQSAKSSKATDPEPEAVPLLCPQEADPSPLNSRMLSATEMAATSISSRKAAACAAVSAVSSRNGATHSTPSSERSSCHSPSLARRPVALPLNAAHAAVSFSVLLPLAKSVSAAASSGADALPVLSRSMKLKSRSRQPASHSWPSSSSRGSTAARTVRSKSERVRDDRCADAADRTRVTMSSATRLSMRAVDTMRATTAQSARVRRSLEESTSPPQRTATAATAA
mmetsp:Transcript_3537/g.14697  ORF Transcript_3537/g.14697 Transcript_3537/m.14697 type:complete len:437 (+) Transcript_3537:1378-2688(+)